MEPFEHILLKYNFPKRTEKPTTTIDEIEGLVKFKLPSDYKAYLQNYSGFELSIGKEYLRLWGIDELVVPNNEYSIVEYLANTLGIGHNGGGELIAIELIDRDKFRVVLSPFGDLDTQNHIEIGTSFTDFLVRLDNGREWFENIA